MRRTSADEEWDSGGGKTEWGNATVRLRSGSSRGEVADCIRHRHRRRCAEKTVTRNTIHRYVTFERVTVFPAGRRAPVPIPLRSRRTRTELFHRGACRDGDADSSLSFSARGTRTQAARPVPPASGFDLLLARLHRLIDNGEPRQPYCVTHGSFMVFI